MSEDQTLSQVLRRAREKRGQTIEEISHQTGLSATVVRGLEADRFDVVEPVFVRMALRTYAQHLGLDEQELLARLDRQLPTQSPPAGPSSTPPRRLTLSADERVLRTAVIIVGALAVVMAAVVLFWALFGPDIQSPPRTHVPMARPALHAPATAQDTGAPPSRSTSKRSPRPAASVHRPASDTLSHPHAQAVTGVTATVAPHAAPARPARLAPPAGRALESASVGQTPRADTLPPGNSGNLGPADQASMVASAGQTLHLTVEAVDTTWIQVDADGRRVFQGLVPRGHRLTWRARERFLVNSGRALGLRYWVQGALLDSGRLGDPTRVLHFRATATDVVLLDSRLNPLGPPVPLTSGQP